MCLSCGGWPWSHQIHLAPAPVREEHIILDQNHAFYPDYRTGIHHPGPVYQSNQTNQSGTYYYPGNGTSPAGYYVNGYYHGSQPPPSTGWPYTSSSSYTCYPFSATSASYSYLNPYSPFGTAPPMPMNLPSPWATTSATAQAAAAVAANAALSAMPSSQSYFAGATAADIQAQNAIMAANMAAVSQMPNQLAPYKPGQSQQFWCKELDGSWTLREYNDVIMGDLGQGHWDRHPTSGYYYYIRHTA